MPFNGLLFENWEMSLINPIRVMLRIRIRPSPKVILSLLRLPHVIVLPVLTLGVTSLFEEVLGEAVGLLAAGGAIETEEREFDLWVSGIGVELVVGRAKSLVDVVDVFEDGFH
jgi:hypothetical protein